MKKRMSKKVSAPQLVTLVFMILILVGTGLLMLPVVTNDGQGVPFLDALFTATSAICVTGLSTFSISEQYNIGGQAILLILIEIGGIGFMSIPVFFYILAKKRVHLSTRMILRESLNLDRMNGEFQLAWYIIRIAFLIQFLGICLLALAFVPRFGWQQGLWFSIFHAISSFCNAGFDLFGNSLVSFQSDPFVLGVISLLIIAGGLGFLVWFDLLATSKRHSLHSRIALLAMVALLILGTAGFFVTEYHSSLLSGDSIVSRFFQLFFLAVTPRTAGFYSIDYGQMSQAGLMLTMILMYIGGTSGSTAGGLKTTTVSVLIIKIRSLLKGRKRAEVFGRTIKEAAVSRAFTLFFLTLSLCFIAIFLLSITESMPQNSQFGLEYIAFEVFSAFGTVGLTMGLTPYLSVFGKLLIILLMFIGRVGIMTVAFSLMTKANRREAGYKFPDETVMIG
ncbi:TrkH family potassium uptake protein [Enterococcus gallinarum]|uniref:TrkH family potassium uptake protein n=1 Tax=Enterococcus gallinarum TaxID=1353 RepID=UPI0028924CEF|nr:TrkH family potassium uptake protein [Enterococcus gallinarum]MDT2721044.1 TrkH family potassium uptake protein [Enterococcus gallinarum]